MGHIPKSGLAKENAPTRTGQCISNFKLYESELLKRNFLDVDLEVSLRTFIEIGSFIKFLNFLK